MEEPITPKETASEKSPLITAQSIGEMSMEEKFTKIIQPCVAELCGIALFVFIGTSSVSSDNLLTVGVAHGLALGVAIASLGSISGGHYNPAVTLAVYMSGGISTVLAVLYVLAQLIGAILGAAFCKGVLNYAYESGADTRSAESITVYEQIQGGNTLVADDVSTGTAILAEIIATSLLVLAVLFTALDKRGKSNAAPVYIGLSVLVDILAVGPVTGASMNPARSFGPAVVYSSIDSIGWDDQWVYWVGPLSGAALMAIFYRLFFGDDERRLFLKKE